MIIGVTGRKSTLEQKALRNEMTKEFYRSKRGD